MSLPCLCILGCVSFVQQDVDDDHLRAVNLALELEDLMGTLDFLRVGYDEVIMRFSSFICHYQRWNRRQTLTLRHKISWSVQKDFPNTSTGDQGAGVTNPEWDRGLTWRQQTFSGHGWDRGKCQESVRQHGHPHSGGSGELEQEEGEADILSYTTRLMSILCEGRYCQGKKTLLTLFISDGCHGPQCWTAWAGSAWFKEGDLRHDAPHPETQWGPGSSLKEGSDHMSKHMFMSGPDMLNTSICPASSLQFFLCFIVRKCPCSKKSMTQGPEVTSTCWRPGESSPSWRRPWDGPSRIWLDKSANTRSWWTSRWPWSSRLGPITSCWRVKRRGVFLCGGARAVCWSITWCINNCFCFISLKNQQPLPLPRWEPFLLLFL